MKQTFAQYLLNNILPEGIVVDKPLDASNFNSLLKEVATKHEDKYAQVVQELKRLGDKLSTYEGNFTVGLDEITTPNKTERNKIIKQFTPEIENEKQPWNARLKAMEDLQKSLSQLDSQGKDSATEFVGSSMGGKKTQLMKMRTSPGVVGDGKGGVVPIVFDRSYAEGPDVLHTWLGSTEARSNSVQGQVQTSAPGELSKIMSNLLSQSVVSEEDCGTKRGIELFTRDEDILGRYLVSDTAQYKRNTLVDEDVQQNLLKKNISKVMVRSPQTCQAKGPTVCSKCMGNQPGSGKPYKIGDNAGMMTAGTLSEPATQLVLSAKHSTAMAKEKNDLEGEKGFRTVIDLTDHPRMQIICEVYGEVFWIRKASQGGYNVVIRETRRVPERYIVRAKPHENMKRHWVYYIPVQLKLLDNIKKGVEVYPGMPLTDGVENIRDVARLRGLGMARSSAANNMYSVYKNTGQKLPRVHFELLARTAHPYVKIEKAPMSFPFKRGEIVEYDKFEEAAGKHRNQLKKPEEAIGMTLMEGVREITAGTPITEQVVARLKKANINQIRVTSDVEVSPASTPMSRVVNKQQDWVAAMNHRYLKDQIKDAAATGKRSNIHGYSPITAYAYGLEMGEKNQGRY